jgi:hypothetical protein
MRASEKDRLAAAVADRRVDFEVALSDKRKYPMQQFEDSRRAAFQVSSASLRSGRLCQGRRTIGSAG